MNFTAPLSREYDSTDCLVFNHDDKIYYVPYSKLNKAFTNGPMETDPTYEEEYTGYIGQGDVVVVSRSMDGADEEKQFVKAVFYQRQHRYILTIFGNGRHHVMLYK